MIVVRWIRAFVGFNVIAGGKGDDEINAVNDAVDDINCGGGKDKVFYDANVDITTNCEDRRPR